MKKDIAILLPYKEKYSKDSAGAASIWVKDYIAHSKLASKTIIYGNLPKSSKPLSKNFKSLEIQNSFTSKNLQYTQKLYNEYLKYNFKIIEIHNRPESLLYLINKKVRCKLIFVYHNNPTNLRGSNSSQDRIRIIENTDQIYFVSNWVKKKFFEGLPFNHRNNCDVLYPAIKPLKKFPKKKKIIIFSGKLNSSKGYDVYGKAVIKILNEFKNWKALAIGNEPREKYNFNHNRLSIKDWVTHDDILNLYRTSSISVVPSKWQEPFGRTAMESAAYGCATLTSKNGGLPETFERPVFIEKVTEDNLYYKIKHLIKDELKMKKLQRFNFKNVKHNLFDQVQTIDTLKEYFLLPKINTINKKNLKILHVATFDERNDHRLFNISISNKLSKGFVRNNHDIINFSYRNYLSKSVFNKNQIINKKILNICENYRPDLVILGHNNIIENKNIIFIKDKFKSKFILWYEDALGYKGNGPNWKNNLKLIEKNKDLINQYFLTTHPDEIKSHIIKNKLNYLPIPVDQNIEFLENFKNKNKHKDLFFALSHGVNYGKLKKGKGDEREDFVNKLLLKYPNIKYNILGYSNEPPKWNYDFFKELSKCKMALNLSRGKPLKYTSSNRIAALIGNGIYTFIDKKTKFDDFFNEDEVGTYKDINDLGNKIENLLLKPKLIDEYSKNGKNKYFKLFNSSKIAREIIEKTF